MITRIEIDGFKSFLDFELDVRPCTVLVGGNGSGKSNLLEALDLVRRTVRSGFPATPGADTPHAPLPLFHHAETGGRGHTATVISIKVGMIVPSADGPLPVVVWLEIERESGAPRSLGAAPLLRGSVWVSSLERTGWMRRQGIPEELSAAMTEARERFLRRTGTDWVSLDDAEHPAGAGDGELLALLHRECETWQPLALDPAAMRRPSAGSELEPLQADGANLAAVLHRLGHTERHPLEEDLTALLPETSGIRPLFDERRGEYDFDVRLGHTGWASPALLSGGTLRTLALLAAWRDERRAGVLAVEEPENGLHPTTLVGLVGRLRRGIDGYADMAERATRVRGFRQLLVATQSPALLSALRHETAGNLVFLEQTPHTDHKHQVESMVTRAHPLREQRPGEDPGETLSAEQITRMLDGMQRLTV
ncbi:AAA family ATPase [Streptomyces sp. JJ36]|uniref:AAA family ATPase n=1 Tax=Streptomyces sp. JJ36 TaxID=2736645 RepID=UPI001F03219D|nr:AAA family ATPase [Streptomyces sp. JJ36]MCF6522392.1 AAA family ATPase [Streptomyces sp. JJ36]